MGSTFPPQIIAAASILCACSSPAGRNDQSPTSQAEAVSSPSLIYPKRSIRASTTNGPTYGGGPLLSNVHVVSVFWGPNVNTTITGQIGGFYSAVTADSYIDWLDEYDSLGTSTPHSVGRGSLAGTFTITPGHTSNSLTDDDVATELASQIGSHVLPTPDANTLYFVQFPPGVVIAAPLGEGNSCVDYCAYHYFATKTVSGSPTTFSYAIMPDFGPGSACQSGCAAGTMFQNFTTVASHELIESITDTQPFSGWSPEIGDYCTSLQGTIIATTGTSYSVQAGFSAASGDCMFDGNPRAISTVTRGNTWDAFYRGSDNNLHTFDGTQPTTDVPLGGPIASAPKAISRTSTSIDVFVRGTDGALYTKSWTGTQWTGFSRLGPEQFVGSPAAISIDGSTIDVFVRGTDNTLKTKSWNGSSWSSTYTQLGTNQFVGNPSVASSASNRVDVFVRGTDGSLYSKARIGGTWDATYTSHGTPKFLGNPSAVSWAANRLAVFVHGTDGELYWQYFTGTSWTGYLHINPGHQFVGSPTAVAGGGSISVVVRGTDGTLYETDNLMPPGGSWGAYYQVAPQQVIGTPSALSASPVQVFVRGTDDALYTTGTFQSKGYLRMGGSLY